MLFWTLSSKQYFSFVTLYETLNRIEQRDFLIYFKYCIRHRSFWLIYMTNKPLCSSHLPLQIEKLYVKLIGDMHQLVDFKNQWLIIMNWIWWKACLRKFMGYHNAQMSITQYRNYISYHSSCIPIILFYFESECSICAWSLLHLSWNQLCFSDQENLI